jgi:hypothetical protein
MISKSRLLSCVSNILEINTAGGLEQDVKNVTRLPSPFPEIGGTDGADLGTVRSLPRYHSDHFERRERP